MKRILCVILTACLLLSVLVFPSSAYDYGVDDVTVTVGGIPLPLPEYPVGSYATTDGEPCNGYHCLNTYELPYGGSVYVYGKQCIGFARYVFYRLFGVLDCTFTGKGGYYSVVKNQHDVTKEDMALLFNSNQVLPGAHIRVATSSEANDGHSMVYMMSDEDYIYTYECNLNWQCDVSVVRRTWEQFTVFANKKGGLAFVHMPDEYPDPVEWDCATDGHKWITDSTETSLPSGLHDGYTTQVCAICGTREQTTVSAEYCAGGYSCPGRNFPDMPKPKNWAHNAIEYVLEYGLLSGLGNGTFDPSGSMTRSMLVNVLWRAAGKPKPTGNASFSDVKNGSWYTDSVLWAAENKVASGTGNGKFDPNGNVTREQIAVILQNFCRYQNKKTDARADISAFADNKKVSSWAVDAMKWAVAEGLISGRESDGKRTLDPQGNATRAEVSSILMRYVKEDYDAQLRVGIVNTSVNIRSGPGTEYAQVSSAGKGTELFVLFEQSGWYRIRTHKGTLGYIRSDLVDIVEE